MEEEVIKISGREKRQHFFYLMILFIIAATLMIWVVFRNNWISIHGREGEEVFDPQEDQRFIENQQKLIPMFDTVVANIGRLEKSDDDFKIKNMISSDIENIRNQARYMSSGEAGKYYQVFNQMTEYLNYYKGEAERFTRKKSNSG